MDYHINKLVKMKKDKLVLGIVLFTLGIIGVLSILTMTIALPEETSRILLEQFTTEQIKLLTLINPTIMLIGAVLLGVFMHDKVSLNVPKRLYSRMTGIIRYHQF